jgi:Domain of unknown function (DUF4345)
MVALGRSRFLRRSLLIAPALERRVFQIAVAVGGLVPVGAGLLGAVLGSGMVPDGGASLSLDSHVRYLSGLLLAIGLAFWFSIPHIETHGARFRLLTAIVFIGGLARLAGLSHGIPSPPMLFGLAMELVVTPLLCLWQMRIAGHHRRE